MSLLTRDWEKFGARVLRPHRARLAEARAVVVGADDPAEAWRRLQERELVPGPAVVAGLGSVYRTAGRPEETEWRPLAAWPPGEGGGGGLEVPAGVDEAVTLASDPEGIARAARYAARVASLLGPEGGTVPRVWVGVAPQGCGAPVGRGGVDAWRSRVETATGQRSRRSLVWRRVFEAGPRVAMGVVAADDAGMVVLGAAEDVLPEGLGEALLGVWEAGYGLWSVEPERVVLLAPRV